MLLFVIQSFISYNNIMKQSKNDRRFNTAKYLLRVYLEQEAIKAELELKMNYMDTYSRPERIPYSCKKNLRHRIIL